MTLKTQKNHKGQRGWQKRVVAVMVTICLLLGNLNLSAPAYAAGDEAISITVGEGITAVIKDGVLTLTGQGETYDFNAETAPFLDYKDEIQSLNIGDGITYLGAYLFYNLGSLSGELILPADILGIGDAAFSGDNEETAPKFTQVQNLFVQGKLKPVETPKPEETTTPEETTAPEETVTPEETVNPEETQNPEPTPGGEDTVPDESNPPETGEGEKQEPTTEPSETDTPSTQEPGQTQEPEQNQDENTSDEETPSIGEGETDSSDTLPPTVDDNSNVTEIPNDATLEIINDILIPPLFAESTGESQISQETASDVPATIVPNPGNGDGSDNSNENAEPGEGNTGGDDITSGGSNADTNTPGEDSGNGTVTPGENSDSGIITPGGESDNETVNPDEGSDNGTVTPGEGTDSENNTPEEDGDTEAATPGEGGNGETPVPGEGDGNTDEEQPPSEEGEIITQQQIANPSSIFYEGQTGIAICSAENFSFIEAAKSAGYQVAERFITLTLDDAVSMEMSVADNQISLPKCPDEIKSPDEDTPFFTHEFAGWTEAPSHKGENVLSAGEAYPVGGVDALSLYSVWNSVSRYQLKTEAKLDGGTAVYSLINETTGKAAVPPAGYTFLYQWQIADKDETSALWEDISGAAEEVYRRTIEQTDSSKQFRCKVTVERLTRSASVMEPLMLYSDAAAGVVEKIVVYVDQKAGDDSTGDGSKSYPFKTFDKAKEKLKTAAAGGSIDSNYIFVLGEYSIKKVIPKPDDAHGVFGDEVAVPVTISGDTNNAVLQGYPNTSSKTIESPLTLYEDLRIENIEIKDINHIYGNGHNITIGDNVNCNGIYLYGSGRQKITDTIGRIEVRSGKFARIIGYVRSNTNIEADNKTAEITVAGTAEVGSIISGLANGKISNADVVINIKGGTVTSLAGGNQGHQNTASPYIGKTTINISGGTVKNLYGAGTGRNVSIPTYLGNIAINVTGGKVDNIYGAGSAAFVISDDEKKSKVKICVSGGEVGNIFAAGKGDDPSVIQRLADSGNIDPKIVFLPDAEPKDFGSVTGDVNITVNGQAVVTGNIYASGEGAKTDSQRYDTDNYDTRKNAYLNGNATITVSGNSTVKGNIYGGGKGITDPGYEECARVTDNSEVTVEIAGGTVEGNVYGGGENGRTMGKTKVEISGGIVRKSVYGGALGKTKQRLVYGGSTVNMTDGWVQGNLYGGSELSNDGPDPTEGKNVSDLIFVNLVGGTVKGNVFGGGYRGVVNGSTHLHIGMDAPNDCAFYITNSSERPELQPNSNLSVEGSVYAGGDYGGDGSDYNTITVTGTSHVYVDGKGYESCGDKTNNTYSINIAGGVFGSGASCDAGSTRLVTLEDFGNLSAGTNGISSASHTITSIQRADRVILSNSHVRITGQSDVANTNQTALYSINRIGDHGVRDASIENALILKGGSTIILDSAVIETANFKSVDSTNELVTADSIKNSPNTICFNTGTEFRISYTKTENGISKEIYGSVTGYTYMLAEKDADAYAYARLAKRTDNGEYQDVGGFLDNAQNEIKPTEVLSTGNEHRYWKVGGEAATSVRNTVLTVQKLSSPGSDGYAIAMGSIQLPPAKKGTSYKIKGVTKGADNLTLVDAAKESNEKWVDKKVNSANSSGSVNLQGEKDKIKGTPLSTFGLYMKTGSGFEETSNGKIVSDASINTGDSDTIIDTTTSKVTADGVTPYINFYLTYYNEGITSSKSLGKIVIELENASDSTKTEMNVEIVTKTSELSDETVELYATQSGSYSGKLTIPSGAVRELYLTNVVDQSRNLVNNSGSAVPESEKFSITMQPERSNGWNPVGLMEEPYDLGSFNAPNTLLIGTTDDRHEAVINFTLRNNGNFSAKKNPDIVVLTLKDKTSLHEFEVTLNVNWKDSVVTDIVVSSGRQYNELITADRSSVKISQKSSVTASFKMRDETNSDSLWLELKNKRTGERVELPKGSKWTLFKGDGYYYYYQVNDSQYKEIGLSSFREMWGRNTPTGQIAEDTVLTVIADFGDVSNFPTGEYSIHLRTNTGADSGGADFTVNPSPSKLAFSSENEGLSRGEKRFTLSISAGSDTRIKDGAAVVLTPGNGVNFPKGVEFRYKDQTYYPSNGKVYLPLSSSVDGSHEITMDTSKSAGLSTENFTLNAQVYPISWSAGEVINTISNLTATYSVKANPVYGLKVTSSDSRVIKAGSTLTFEVNYINSGGAETNIKVTPYQKVNGGYNIVSNLWEDIKTVNAAASPQTITVTVPAGTSPGTYRLLFELGDRKVPYNIIVI